MQIETKVDQNTKMEKQTEEKFFKKGPTPASFLFFSSTKFTEETVEINGIRTRIVGVKGGHADSLTTTTAQSEEKFMKRFRGKEMKIRERSKSEKRIKRERQNVIKGTREKRNSFQSNNTIFTTNVKNVHPVSSAGIRTRDSLKLSLLP